MTRRKNATLAKVGRETGVHDQGSWSVGLGKQECVTGVTGVRGQGKKRTWSGEAKIKSFSNIFFRVTSAYDNFYTLMSVSGYRFTSVRRAHITQKNNFPLRV